MEETLRRIHEINSELRLLHLDMMENSNRMNKEDFDMIENYLSHTSSVANKIIEIAKRKMNE
jgi:hypothetical protein